MPADGSPSTDEQTPTELPDSVVEDVERLHRLERNAVDEAEKQTYHDHRETLLEEHGFTDRIREDDGSEVLVLHPTAWHDPHAGVIRTEEIEDLSRAVEIPLDGTTPGDPDDWEAVDERNRAIVEAVRDAHGDIHAANASAFADFMSNHCAKPIEDASRAEIDIFTEEYFVRNAWPTDEQRDTLDASLEYIFEIVSSSP